MPEHKKVLDFKNELIAKKVWGPEQTTQELFCLLIKSQIKVRLYNNDLLPLTEPQKHNLANGNLTETPQSNITQNDNLLDSAEKNIYINTVDSKRFYIGLLYNNQLSQAYFSIPMPMDELDGLLLRDSLHHYDAACLITGIRPSQELDIENYHVKLLEENENLSAKTIYCSKNELLVQPPLSKPILIKKGGDILFDNLQIILNNIFSKSPETLSLQDKLDIRKIIRKILPIKRKLTGEELIQQSKNFEAISKTHENNFFTSLNNGQYDNIEEEKLVNEIRQKSFCVYIAMQNSETYKLAEIITTWGNINLLDICNTLVKKRNAIDDQYNQLRLLSPYHHALYTKLLSLISEENFDQYKELENHLKTQLHPQSRIIQQEKKPALSKKAPKVRQKEKVLTKLSEDMKNNRKKKFSTTTIVEFLEDNSAYNHQEKTPYPINTDGVKSIYLSQKKTGDNRKRKLYFIPENGNISIDPVSMSTLERYITSINQETLKASTDS